MKFFRSCHLLRFLALILSLSRAVCPFFLLGIPFLDLHEPLFNLLEHRTISSSFFPPSLCIMMRKNQPIIIVIIVRIMMSYYDLT